MKKVKFSLPNRPPKQNFKYEMARRKEKWKAINDPIEKQLFLPPEAQQSVVEEVVSELCYEHLAEMLDLPERENKHSLLMPSKETIIPFNPPDDSGSWTSKSQDTLKSKVSFQTTVSGSSVSSQYESLASSILSKKSEILDIKTSTDWEESDALSDFVEIEKETKDDREEMLKHKAILRFLSLPEAEAASWRVKDAKDVNDLSQMTLEEQGDFLINKIAVDFCNWIRDLGGDEKSFISEEIVKELFQIGMDNPATRAICMKTREERVLYSNLAQFLQMPEKAFHEVLSKHLNWDAEVEKMSSKLIAFGKSLPKNLRFKTPKNKTQETWLEWNKLSEEQLSFADVYKDIKDLRSTREYCKWLMTHPEYKKPQYLVDQGVFNDPKLSDGRPLSVTGTLALYKSKPSHKTAARNDHGKGSHVIAPTSKHVTDASSSNVTTSSSHMTIPSSKNVIIASSKHVTIASSKHVNAASSSQMNAVSNSHVTAT